MSGYASEAVSRFASGVLLFARQSREGDDCLAHSTQKLIDCHRPRVLDVGAGKGDHALFFARMGMSVDCCDLSAGCDYMTRPPQRDYYHGIWCSHTLEHMLDPHACLHKMIYDLMPNGVLAITVPPLKHQIVGGHVNLFNAGLLLYRLVLAGIDCSNARVGTYGYNISVIVRKVGFDMPKLVMDHGDLERLAPYFPSGISGPFDGRMENVAW